MNAIRTKILGILTTALIFASFGLFAGAASAVKIYTMGITTPTPTSVEVTITNVTPPTEPGNSTIKSFIIKVPTGAPFKITASLGSTAPATIVPSADGKSAAVNGFTGLKAAGNTPNTITLKLQLSSAPCGSNLWTAIVYTGNFSQTTFALVDVSGGHIDGTTQTLGCVTLTGLPATFGAGASRVYPVTLTNPAGNATITGLTITAPAGVAATAAFPSGGVASNTTSAPFDVTVSAPCGTSMTNGKWSSSVSGPNVPVTTSSSTLSVTDCSLAFTPGPPTTVPNGATMVPPIAITALDGFGEALNWSGDVTWTLIPQGGAAGTLAGTSGVCVVGSAPCPQWEFPDLTITGKLGDSFKLNATTTLGNLLASISTTSVAFTLRTGTLGCDLLTNTGGALNPDLDLAYVNVPPNWGLIRGPNKDGLGCVPVPYDFVLDTSSVPARTSFIIPTGTGQQVAALYVVVWPKLKVVTNSSSDANSGWTIRRPKVSWGTPLPPVYGTNDYVPALACVKDYFETTGTTVQIVAQLAALMPKIPDAPPFNTPYNASTCPNCIKNNTAYPQYQPGQPAKMCVAQQGWTSVGKDSDGNTLIQQWNKVIDQSDGFMSVE